MSLRALRIFLMAALLTGLTGADGARSQILGLRVSPAEDYQAPAILPGAPRPLKRAPKPKRKSFSHALPDLAPYPTSAEALRKSALGPRMDALTVPSTATAMPAPPRRPAKPKTDPEPFAPAGFDVGLLRAHAYSETSLGANSNPNEAPAGARGSALIREEIGLAGVSDWSNHGFAGDMRIGYSDYPGAPSANAPDGAGKFLARIDASRDTRVNIDGAYTLSTQTQTSPNLYNNGASTRLEAQPLIASYGGGLGVSHAFNRSELTLRGSFQRNYWADAHFANGSTQYLSRDSYDDYGVTLRASYELLPGVKPFVESFLDERIHDTTFGTSGYARNSAGASLSAGSTFELTRLVTGSASAGYAERNYRDPRLANLRGPIFDISLIWIATPLTKVNLRTLTTMDETTVAGASGAITRTATVELAHALRRNLTLIPSAGIQNVTYPGNPLNQTYYTAGLKAEYNLTRGIVLKGAYAFQRMISSQPGTDYTANILTLGLRLQQ